MFFLVFLFSAILLPEIGDKLYFRWVDKPENRKMVEEAVILSKEGKYEPSSKLYKIKIKIKDFFLSSYNICFYIPSIILNALAIVFWLIRNDPSFVYISVVAGITVGIGIVLNFFSVSAAFSLYKKPAPKFKLRRLGIKLLAHMSLIFTFLFYGLMVYYQLIFNGIFEGDVPFIGLLVNIAFYFHQGIYIALAVILIASRGLLGLKKGISSKDTGVSVNKIKKLLFSIIRYFFIAILSILLIAASIVSLLVLAGDFFMFFTFFGNILIIGLFVPLGIWLAWLLGKSDKMGHKQKYWAIINVTVIIVGINIIPMIHTPLFTNSSLDTQFADVFGANWVNNIPENKRDTMRMYHYSFYDNLYDFRVDSNTKINISYVKDYPSQITGNTSIIEHTFYFDAYLPPWVPFGSGSGNNEHLPVVIFFHGEVENKGPWNANTTSQYLANQGYLVCDMNYGYMTLNEHGDNYNGYLLSEMVGQIGEFTKFLYDNRDYYHADLSSVYFSGRHLGGLLSLICGLGYNKTLNGIFSEHMMVSGVIPLYGLSDIGEIDMGFYSHFTSRGHGWIEGTSDKVNASYNPDWDNLNPTDIIDNSVSPTGSLAPILFLSGTHDYMVPKPYSDRFIAAMKENGHKIIVGYYLLGSDGFDGAHMSPWGQSIIYYYERFLALTC